MRREQDAFREVSVGWRRFMQFPSSCKVQNVSPDIKRRIKQGQDNQEFERCAADAADRCGRHLGRVIIDECHFVLQSTKKFRPKVLQLRNLISRQMQVVCLTATLPPRREPAFMSIMDMEPSEVRMIRESTVRPNIRYSVTTYDGEASTIALGEGIGSSTIRVVIHVGGIEKLDDFGQQSDQAGRDGVTASESIVLQAEKESQQGQSYMVRTGEEEPEMMEYLGGRRCRRAVLDADMDGDGTGTSCRTGEQQECRYRGRLMEVVAIIMFHAGDEVMARIFDEIEKTGGDMEAHEWLGTTIKDEEIEMSGMAWLFCEWVERERGASAEFPTDSMDLWTF